MASRAGAEGQNSKILTDLSSNKNQKPFQKKFATLAARAVFKNSFLLQKQVIYYFLPGNNHLNSNFTST